MSDSSEHFHGGTWERPPEVNLGERGHHLPPPARLSLTPAERANLPTDALALVSPLLNRDPSTWTLGEVQAVTAALEGVPRGGQRGEAAAAVQSRMHGATRVVQDHEANYKPLVDEVRRINEELVAARRRPNSTTSTISRHMATLHVDRMKREAGVAAREEVREQWRTNPRDPEARTEMVAAQAAAEREFELRRPQLEADEAARDEAERVKRHNAKNSTLHDRKSALVKVLTDAHVPVPPEPRELVT
jgi:hypothetical protein